jgi:predicted small lipoprotein YifL
MRAFKIIVLLLIVAFVITACGGKGGPKGVKKLYYPDWWQKQDNAEYVQTYGMATKVSQNSSYDAAYANAMLQAAQYVETYVKGMVKNYEEEAGVNDPQVLALTSKVVKAVANAKFTNVMVTKQETIVNEDNRYQTFVRVSVPKEAVNKNLMNKIKNEEALYNQFKASQAFDELDKEIEKYDE